MWVPRVNYHGRSTSYLTAQDHFCGAGGGAIALDAAGVFINVSVNHWKLAVETHAANFPGHEHDVTDLTQVDPARYPRTDIGLFTPACTFHSPARGEKVNDQGQLLLWDDVPPTADEAVRSRSTMNEVVRFSAYHRYKIVIVENVIEVIKWAGFQNWLAAMHSLGYDSKAVYFNSQFAPSYPHAAPQSRDRLYYVFWQRSIGRAPDLDLRPPAFCSACSQETDAVQVWKQATKRWGKYQRQYIYCCPHCGGEVRPFCTPVAAAIDFSLPIQKIGERSRPLDPKTMQRIQAGLDRFGNTPALLDLGFNYQGRARTRPISEPAPTQTTAQTMGFLCSLSFDPKPRPLTLPAPTQTGRQSLGLVTMPLNWSGFLTTYYRNGWPIPLHEPASTVTTVDRFGLVESTAAVRIEDFGFRMLHPDREIKCIMGFPPDYRVLGSQKQQTKQLGNSLTPAVITEITQRAVAILN
jgi:DNA (cytosine-5)-methyltransferase 1